MKCLVIKLKPKSSFHLGERERWLEGSKIHFPADTLFSALCQAHQLLYGEVDTFINGFLKGEPPFLLSSAFPFWHGDYFFPLPKSKFIKPEEGRILKESLKEALNVNRNRVTQEINPKDIKKIQFVNLPSLRLLLSGLSLFDLILKAAQDPNLKTIPLLFSWPFKEKNQSQWPSKKTPWIIENVPRVALSRFSNHPGENFFHFGRIFYAPDASLFCLLEIKLPEWENKIKALFYLLADEGIGGDRTCGQGLLEKPEFDEIELPETEDAQWLYSLSPYFPAENEYSGLAQSFYELEERKGYIFSPFGRTLRRRSIRIFTEGSVFPRNVERRGKLVDVTPEAFKAHRVYRYSLLFALPCQMEAKANEN
ncbi:MAG: type III-A CRISPR-associated RAMP protein Csm4 [Candidatus Aminicenantes bacterium]|nr:type III-A CRISPR-associated RAMP protein Csm4 [Candidatus Aminicenantes bacterium]